MKGYWVMFTVLATAFLITTCSQHAEIFDPVNSYCNSLVEGIDHLLAETSRGEVSEEGLELSGLGSRTATARQFAFCLSVRADSGQLSTTADEFYSALDAFWLLYSPPVTARSQEMLNALQTMATAAEEVMQHGL